MEFYLIDNDDDIQWTPFNSLREVVEAVNRMSVVDRRRMRIVSYTNLEHGPSLNNMQTYNFWEEARRLLGQVKPDWKQEGF